MPITLYSFERLGVQFNLIKILKLRQNRQRLFPRVSKLLLVLVILNLLGRFLFQLRLGLSLLKYDKKRHNFVDTPNDLCDCHCASEDIKHFFFYCHLFRQQRIKLFASVSRILLNYPNITLLNNCNLLLYGNTLLCFVDNKRVLQSSIQFIKESGRFVT